MTPEALAVLLVIADSAARRVAASVVPVRGSIVDEQDMRQEAAIALLRAVERRGGELSRSYAWQRACGAAVDAVRRDGRVGRLGSACASFAAVADVVATPEPEPDLVGDVLCHALRLPPHRRALVVLLLCGPPRVWRRANLPEMSRMIGYGWSSALTNYHRRQAVVELRRLVDLCV